MWLSVTPSVRQSVSFTFIFYLVLFIWAIILFYQQHFLPYCLRSGLMLQEYFPLSSPLKKFYRLVEKPSFNTVFQVHNSLMIFLLEVNMALIK